jgi:DNA polymerase III alpha subunit
MVAEVLKVRPITRQVQPGGTQQCRPQDAGLGESCSSGNGSEEERLRGEKETLGVYLTGHPINRIAAELAALGAPGCAI